MKRLFIHFSNLFILIFLLWIAFISPNTVIHRSLPVIGILQQEREVVYEELSSSLDQLAKENNSLIARQIQKTDSKGQVKFSYDIYGEGALPNGIKKEEKEFVAKESLLTNYYILSGNLTLEKLDQKLHDLGFSKSFMNKPNPLQNFMVFFSSGSQSLALVIFIISFAALTIIQKTLEMRSAGIRYISGIRRYQLFGHSLMEDGKELFLGCIGGSVLGAILIYYLQLTPYYLDIQRILVSPEEKERLNHLQAGEFGLLLPEKLKGQEEELKKRYEDYLTPSDEQGKSQLPMKARVTYLPNNQKRFIYNNTPMIYQQFLTDPILVVVLPRSFGGYDNPYFSHLNSYLYFDGLEKSKKLVVENGLEKNVSQYDYAASVYQQMIQSIQLENLITIAGGIFAIATSILLFNTMNFLYFEEFRRPIFLKKIAGLGFVKIHQMILLSESILLLLGSFLTFLLTQEWWIALVTLLLFITNAWFILLYRSHKEDHLLATVLKGA